MKRAFVREPTPRAPAINPLTVLLFEELGVDKTRSFRHADSCAGRSTPLPAIGRTCRAPNIQVGRAAGNIVAVIGRAKQVVEGEMYGAPVPGRWPGGGPSDQRTIRMQIGGGGDSPVSFGSSGGSPGPEARPDGQPGVRTPAGLL